MRCFHTHRQSTLSVRSSMATNVHGGGICNQRERHPIGRVARPCGFDQRLLMQALKLPHTSPQQSIS